MKSAEERSNGLCREFGIPPLAAPVLVRALLEYGRDQRHLCAEAVAGLEGRAHALVMNAPAPGTRNTSP